MHDGHDSPNVSQRLHPISSYSIVYKCYVVVRYTGILLISGASLLKVCCAGGVSTENTPCLSFPDSMHLCVMTKFTAFIALDVGFILFGIGIIHKQRRKGTLADQNTSLPKLVLAHLFFWSPPCLNPAVFRPVFSISLPWFPTISAILIFALFWFSARGILSNLETTFTASSKVFDSL